MKAFWREKELSEHETKLLTLCLEAHAKSAMRQNVSTAVLIEASRGSGDYTKSLVAALSTLGAVHAPLIRTWHLLMSNPTNLALEVEHGVKIPGWGSSFEDDTWVLVESHLREHYPGICQRIDAITEVIKKAKPNPSCWTAATGIALEMPPHILPWLFVSGRLNTWTCLYLESVMKAS